MNNAINGSAGMTPDTTMAQSNGYGSDAWASISPYSQSPYGNSPMNEYANWNSYLPHALPSEPLGRMPPPLAQGPTHQLIQPAPPSSQAASLNHQQQQHQQQQQQQHHPQQHHHPQLPMLNTTWPSQLTNPTPTTSYSAPPLSMTPVSAAPSLETPRVLAPAPAPSEKARKTLSTEQKRAMCLYYEENPGTRQADIGAKFGVERSTVSKVLRQKDQLLKRDQEPDHVAAIKRGGKGKHPDFDRTLSNYVRRQQQSGFEVKDDEIMDQAKLFARASGNQDSLLNSLTSSWLQKFKQKHGIGAGGRLMRRASETNIPDSARMSTVRRPSIKKEKRKNSAAAAAAAAGGPLVSSGVTGLGIGIISPTSPNGQMSPLSETRSDEGEDGRAHDSFNLDFTYRANASQSTTSLTSDLRDNTGASSFSGGTMSPTGTLTFSPDPNVGGFAVDQNLNPRNGLSAAEFHPHQQQHQQLHREKRSNTFPSLNIDSATTNNQSNSLSHQQQQMTPRHQIPLTAPSSALESPDQEILAAPFALDTTLGSPPKLRRSGSSSSIAAARSAANTPAPNSAVTSTSVESTSSPPLSPSQDDARRAANTLLSYIQSASSHGQFDQGEYMALVQLTKKLQVHQLQHPQPQHRPSIGGLSRIPEGDSEMIHVPEMVMETS